MGCATFGVAVLSFVLKDMMGAWPTPLGRGTPVLFGILGIALVSPYVTSRVRRSDQ
jgi:hypothetical protein